MQGFRRRFVVPEVVQTSKVDCGPAALKSMLAGFSIRVAYGRLRDLCYTDVDGTSVDRLEQVANELGLEAEQVIVPVDHVCREEAGVLPGILVVTSASGYPHLVVAWRTHGSLVQVMDPARGRLWVTRRALARQMYLHSAIVPSADWRAWAATDEFLRPLRGRMAVLGLTPSDVDAHVNRAAADPSPDSLAALDAATRLTATLRDANALTRGDVARTMAAFADPATHRASPIPDQHWTVRSAEAAADGSPQVAVRGAVVLRARGRSGAAIVAEPADAARRTSRADEAEAEPDSSPITAAIRFLWVDGYVRPLLLIGLLALVVAGATGEVILLQGLLTADAALGETRPWLWRLGALAGVALTLLMFEWLLATAERRLGARFDVRLRTALAEKIPRLDDRYFHSRPISDMAERSHSLHHLRLLPALGIRCLRTALELAVTVAALVWLVPSAAFGIIAGGIAATAIPLFGHSLMAERDLRQRTHAGALSRFHLDALLGRTAIDAHRAGPVMALEHERLLDEWARAGTAVQRAAAIVECLQLAAGLAVTVWLLQQPSGSAVAASPLLFVYWALQLPALGYELAVQLREYPLHRSVLLRVLEPLAGRDEAVPTPASTAAQKQGRCERPAGVELEFRSAAVGVAEQPILSGVTLHIAAGEHVAVVGPSGAGKSTLAGVLLGWHTVTAGAVSVDGRPIDAEAIAELRRRTAWVDPTVRIWDRSLIENLACRRSSLTMMEIDSMIADAGLAEVVERLPAGLHTCLGHNGSQLSAGEAQRVRLGRAFLAQSPSLVVLDEPLRGLEGERRRRLIARLRIRWAKSTLLYITHDLAEARMFDRVLVIERGRVVEDASPQALLHVPTSRFRRLLDAQESLRAQWSRSEWHKLAFNDGRVVGHGADAHIEQSA